jgi:hypothetical protein
MGRARAHARGHEGGNKRPECPERPESPRSVPKSGRFGRSGRFFPTFGQNVSEEII